MKLNSTSRSAFFNPRVIFAFVLCTIGVLLALLGFGVSSSAPAQAAKQQRPGPAPIVGYSYHHDLSPALRDLPQGFADVKQRHEGPENPMIPNRHINMPDTVVQDSHASWLAKLAPSIPLPILNFAGIGFPGVSCSCAPPDTNGEVGTTQYVQMVNMGYQVWDKATGTSVLGPNSIESIWSGFGGLCQSSGFGDPVVIFDQLAKRWVITEFAGTSIPSDECIAVSTTDDATGTYNRYGFHLTSTTFIDYPKIAMWPDAYYMSFNIFNSSGTAYLGPQPFAFDRAAMIAGLPLTTFITFPPLGGNVAPMLPADMDGNKKPPGGSPDPYLGWPDGGHYTLYHFHVDFTGGGSTFTTFATPPAAAFTQPCPLTRACVPELGASSFDWLDSLGDRLMHRLTYRNFPTHESLVGNYTVLDGGVTAPRWFELRAVLAGPVEVYQESTYNPGDGVWRWMGSIAMDKKGNIALGFSASSPTIHPQIVYTGRTRRDPLNTMPQGEAHIIDGAGSQTDTVNRWGDYSAMTVDPEDDRTFWYTNEYYSATTSFNWKTQIANFKFPRPPGTQADQD